MHVLAHLPKRTQISTEAYAALRQSAPSGWLTAFAGFSASCTRDPTVPAEGSRLPSPSLSSARHCLFSCAWSPSAQTRCRSSRTTMTTFWRLATPEYFWAFCEITWISSLEAQNPDKTGGILFVFQLFLKLVYYAYRPSTSAGTINGSFDPAVNLVVPRASGTHHIAHLVPWLLATYAPPQACASPSQRGRAWSWRRQPSFVHLVGAGPRPLSSFVYH